MFSILKLLMETFEMGSFFSKPDLYETLISHLTDF